ncbi:MAG: ABC transporter permease [Desulfobacteraceae bacterium]|nr:MAG: ABC transporter permease [Desulfobacteraceae bacterium]
MAESIALNTAESLPAPRKKRGFLIDATVRLFREKPLGAFGAVIFMLMLVTGVLAGFLARYGYNEINPLYMLKPPSADFWLGTDSLGRDVLSRIIYGARISMIIGFSATSLSIVISVVIGITTGFFGGKYDLIMQRLVDAWMVFPALVFLIVAISITGPGMWEIIFVLALGYGIPGARIIRGATLSTKENTYVHASNSIGASPMRQLLRHILPNIMAPIIILFTTRLAAVILTEATLAFLGLGIPPPTPTWGGMLHEARRYMLHAPLLAIWPGLALTIAVYGINVFGDALRDLLDPRLRGGVGSYGESAVKVKPKKEKEGGSE